MTPAGQQKQIYMNDERRALLATAQRLWPDKSASQLYCDALEYMVDKETRRLARKQARDKAKK